MLDRASRIVDSVLLGAGELVVDLGALAAKDRAVAALQQAGAARQAGTVPYEILTGLGQRFARRTLPA